MRIADYTDDGRYVVIGESILRPKSFATKREAYAYISNDFAMRLDAMIAAARRRLHKAIDIRCAIALGDRKPSTVRRSIGQLYRRGKR